jgi:hypothetical protein
MSEDYCDKDAGRRAMGVVWEQSTPGNAGSALLKAQVSKSLKRAWWLPGTSQGLAFRYRLEEAKPFLVAIIRLS